MDSGGGGINGLGVLMDWGVLYGLGGIVWTGGAVSS